VSTFGDIIARGDRDECLWTTRAYDRVPGGRGLRPPVSDFRTTNLATNATMRPPTRTWWASPRAGALLALLAFGVVAPSEAKAGCRHPGVLASGAALDRLESLMLDDAAPAPRQAPPAGPAPCKGPSCSGQTAPPLAPMSIPPNPAPRWALGALAPPAADPGSEAIPPDDARLHPLHTPLAIFHPPRPPASLPTR